MRLGLLLFLSFFCPPAWSQATTNCKKTIAVNVRDRQGNFVAGLSGASFRAKFHNQPIRVLAGKENLTPVRVIVMLDASGSMLRKWDVARQLAVNMLVALPASSHAGLVVFAEDLVTILDLNHFPNDAIEKLKELNDPKRILSGKRPQTALLDSLADTLGMFGTPVVGDVVFMVSDGGENHSKADWTKANLLLLAPDVRLFAAILHDAYMKTPEQMEGEPNLRSTAEESGGSAIYNHGPELLTEKHLVAESNELYDEISHFYQLELQIRKSDSELGKLDLEVVDAIQNKIKSYKVIHPQKMLGCIAGEVISSPN